MINTGRLLHLHLRPSPPSPPQSVSSISTSDRLLHLHLRPSPPSPPQSISTSDRRHHLHLRASPPSPPQSVSSISTSDRLLHLHLRPSPPSPPQTVRRFPVDPEMSLFVVLLILAGADATCMFPRECVENVTQFPVSCCPNYNGSPCGSAFNRGSCLPVVRSMNRAESDVKEDERDEFPENFFTHQCICKDNYFGHNCGDCMFGRSGDTCNETMVVVRPEIRQKSPKELELFLAQMHYCKNKQDPDSLILTASNRSDSRTYRFVKGSYYDIWANMHNYVTLPFLNNSFESFGISFAHGGPVFPPFHRLLLLCLERSMQKCLKDPTFAIPYYDWGMDPNCSICNNTYLGGNDANGNIDNGSVFSTWRMICPTAIRGKTCQMSNNTCERPRILRNPGSGNFRKPGVLDIQHCLNEGIYDSPPYSPNSKQSFRNCLEGFVNRSNVADTAMHNAMHMYLGGAMSNVPIAANDPIFCLHHAFMDKLFEIALRSYGWNPNSYPLNDIYGQGAYTCMIPFLPCFPPRRMMLPSYSFGYSYTIYNGV